MPRTGLTPTEIRQKAITVAEANIRTYGFEKFRLVDIAKQLGIAHTSLYNHFPDKAALLDAVSEKWVTMVDAELAAIAARKPISTETYLTLLTELFTTLHRRKREKVSTDPELYKAFDSAAEEHKAFIATHLHNVHAAISTLVENAVRHEELTGSPEAIRALLIEATRGFTHPKLVAEMLAADRIPILQQLLHAIFTGLATKPQPSR